MQTGPTLKLDQTKRRLEATDVDLAGSIFVNVNLESARFEDVNLAGTTIADADLSGLCIQQANLTGASIVDSLTDGMKMNGISVADLMAAHRAAQAKGD